MKMHNAMFGVELQYVDSLLEGLGDAVPGALVEFGIFQGGWINHLYERSEALGLSSRPVIGFDSFQGLSTPSPEHDLAEWKPGMYAASRQEVEERVQAKARPRIRLIEGWFADSLKGAAAQGVDRIAFSVSIAISMSRRCSPSVLSTRLSDGAILVFDDWPHHIDKGEGLAFAQWLPTVPWLGFEFLFYGTMGHLYLRTRHVPGVTRPPRKPGV